MNILFYNPVTGLIEHDESAGARFKDKSILNILSKNIILKTLTNYDVRLIKNVKNLTLAHVIDARSFVTDGSLDLKAVADNIKSKEYLLCMNSESVVNEFINKRNKKSTTIFSTNSVPLIFYITMTSPVNVYVEEPEDKKDDVTVTVDHNTVLCYKSLNRYVFSISTKNINFKSVKYIKHSGAKITATDIKKDTVKVDEFVPVDLPEMTAFLKKEFEDNTTKLNL